MRIAHAGICAGGAQQWTSLPRSDCVPATGLQQFIERDGQVANALSGRVEDCVADRACHASDADCAKGIGEIGITGVAGAIGNAVFNATGKRIRDLPITLDKLL